MCGKKKKKGLIWPCSEQDVMSYLWYIRSLVNGNKDLLFFKLPRRLWWHPAPSLDPSSLLAAFKYSILLTFCLQNLFLIVFQTHITDTADTTDIRTNNVHFETFKTPEGTSDFNICFCRPDSLDSEYQICRSFLYLHQSQTLHDERMFCHVFVMPRGRYGRWGRFRRLIC